MGGYYSIMVSSHIHGPDTSITIYVHACLCHIGKCATQVAAAASLYFMYLKIPLHPAHAPAHSNACHSHCHNAGIKNHTLTMLDALVQRSGNGHWSPSCLVHTDNMCAVSECEVGGVTLRDALARWWGGEDVRLRDTCSAGPDGSVACNTACKGCGSE